MWRRLQTLRWYLRWPVKWVILGLTCFAVCYPNPALFVRHVQHWREPNAMIEADNPALDPLLEEVRDRLGPDMKPRQALKVVEAYVYQKVPYRWDWETWGSVDYLPTLDETLKMGAEDCDGQAVVAASLLKALGYKAELVTDFAHVWVKTDKGETMRPGKRRSVTATRRGFSIDWRAVRETLPRALAFGISPFPLIREIIVLVVLWLLLMSRNAGWLLRCLCLLLMLNGLLFCRLGGTDLFNPDVSLQVWGLAHIVGASLVLALASRGARRHASPSPPEPAIGPPTS